ncbi:MAG: MBOAT family O-acyltransferase [Erysipelotrichaceae bacterium]|nr:MBOAT family O-acyltransferase [Erysipelotrichaceae bacterium]
MNFSSLTFVLYFLPLSILLFQLVDKYLSKAVNIYLILVSIFFYAWSDIKITIIFLLSCIGIFIIGKIIERTKSKVLLTASIAIIVGVLCFYKYVDFSIGIVNKLLHYEIDLLYLVLPLGISFASFEAISYLVDIYNGNKSGSLTETLLFLLFFPKVCSGPIVTWKRFKVALKNRESNFNNLVSGAEKIVIGLGKKVILADSLGTIVATVSANYLKIDSISAMLCALCFMLQLYLDFSGYSDMAIGISRIFGFSFAENFNYPYLSKSVGEFYRRWHISLGTFLKEYIYIPLGGSRKGNVYLHLLIVFLVSGIWHGNGTSYIVWGLLIGLAVCLERKLSDELAKVPDVIRWLLTMVFIYFTWILFMMPSLSTSVAFVKTMFAGISGNSVLLTYKYYFNLRIIIIMLISIVVSVCNYKDIKYKIVLIINNRKFLSLLKYSFLLLVFVVSIVFIVNSTYSPFLYFRF